MGRPSYWIEEGRLKPLLFKIRLYILFFPTFSSWCVSPSHRFSLGISIQSKTLDATLHQMMMMILELGRLFLLHHLHHLLCLLLSSIPQEHATNGFDRLIIDPLWVRRNSVPCLHQSRLIVDLCKESHAKAVRQVVLQSSSRH